MNTEQRQYQLVRWSFLTLAIGTFASLTFLIIRFAPWASYAFGRSADCGCAILAYQVPSSVMWTGGILLSIGLWLVTRWSLGFIRHARQWARTLAMAKRDGRFVIHHRSGAWYWIVPGNIPQAYTVGGLRPQIVVSQSLINRLSGSEFQAVLQHETAHVRQFDPLWSAVIDATGYMFAWPTWLRQWAGAAYSWRELVADAVATSNYKSTDALSGAVLKLSDTKTYLSGVHFSPNADRIEKILDPNWTPGHRIWFRQSFFGLALGLGVLLAAVVGLRHAQASLPSTPTGHCPLPVEIVLCQQRPESPMRLRCIRSDSWQCQIVPNRSSNSHGPLSLR